MTCATSGLRAVSTLATVRPSGFFTTSERSCPARASAATVSSTLPNGTIYEVVTLPPAGTLPPLLLDGSLKRA